MNFRVGNRAFTRRRPSGTGPGPSGTVATSTAMRLLLPSAGDADVDADVDVDVLYGGERPRLADRPWVGICMIASIDGSTVVDGLSGGLGNAGDAAVFRSLRRAADAVLVGASTARAESYGPPDKPGLRIGVVTRRGDLDIDAELFASGSGFLVMPDDGPEPPRPRTGTVDVVRAGTGTVDLALALRRLGEVMAPPAFVQAEGGPRLNAGLLASGCVDELDLTLAPVLAGGDGQRVTSGGPPVFERLELAHLATDDSYLFGRWVRRT